MTTTPLVEVPAGLRRWFVVHFVADWVFALPLFFVPEAFLGALGWTVVDPATARAVAAALVGIGTQSLLDRNAGVESFRTMLSLKVMWSAVACLGLAWTGLTGGPPMVWALFGVFLAFNVLWTAYFLKLRATVSPVK